MSASSSTMTTSDQFAQYTAQVAQCLRARKEVNSAAHRSADAYNQVVRLLLQRDDAQLRLLYRALSECVVEVELDRLSEMSDAIMRFNWNSDKRTCEAFIQFLLCLCSAHRNAVAPTLDMLVKQLKPLLVKVPDLQDPSLLVAQVDEASSALVASRALETIKQIVILVPTCTHVLQDTLIRQFPHRRSPRDVLTGYASAVLRVAAFAVPLRPALIKACVEVLLMLDVEICIDDVQFSPSIQRRASNPPAAAEARNRSTDDALQFDLDDPTSLGAAVAVAAGAASIRRHASVPAAVEDASVRLVREAADKLDSLMLIMFEDISMHCVDHGSDVARATRRGLLDSFGVSVLSTNRSKFVQFLAFFCASLDASFATELLDLLLRKLADANEPSLTRQCAAHYVGSLVSRARFVSPALRHSALVSLAAFAQAYIGGMSPSALRPSASLHAVLYACVQAIVYGVCFAYDDYSIAVAQAASIALGLDDGRRGGGDGASSEEGARWPLEQLQLERILSHDTLPLKFCSVNVADEFARLAPSLGLPFVPLLLRRQRGVVLPVDAQWSDAAPQHFFPFDPYMLRLSSSYVDREDTYAHFAMPTVIETNAIAAFAPQHAEAFAAATAALAAEAADELDTDDTDDTGAASSAHNDRWRSAVQARRMRRRSRSPHSSLSGSSVGTPTRDLLFGMGHSGSFSHQAHVMSSSMERLSFK